MNSRNKKLAVLRLLSQESNSISLPELLEKLDRDFKERTVRRWLNEMVLEGLVEKTGHKNVALNIELYKRGNSFHKT